VHARMLSLWVVTLLAYGTPVLAQYAGDRRGAWFAFGGARTSVNITCGGCTRGGDFDAPALILQVGATPNPHLRLGVGFDASWFTVLDTTELVSNVSALFRYYPATGSGLFAEGGLGFSQDEVFSEPSLGWARGWGLTVAVGYDLPRWSKVSIVPRVSYDYGWIGELTYPPKGGTVVRNWTHRMLLVGMAVNLNESRLH
jgi:hypothetical protein